MITMDETLQIWVTLGSVLNVCDVHSYQGHVIPRTSRATAYQSIDVPWPLVNWYQSRSSRATAYQQINPKMDLAPGQLVSKPVKSYHILGLSLALTFQYNYVVIDRNFCRSYILYYIYQLHSAQINNFYLFIIFILCLYLRCHNILYIIIISHCHASIADCEFTGLNNSYRNAIVRYLVWPNVILCLTVINLSCS